MNEFTRQLKKWSSRLTSRKLPSQQHPRGVDSGSGHVDKVGGDRGHGAEGNAFQVNSEPERDNHNDDDQRHGAEGDAFQVNGHSAKSEGPEDDAR